MTDEPAASHLADDLEPDPTGAPPIASETEVEAEAGPPASTPASTPTLSTTRPADRAQQLLTAAVLVLIAASAVLLAVTIANQ
jgi:hypothetical protein